jgi:FMN phosphatase YigB (HAD superfamily)
MGLKPAETMMVAAHQGDLAAARTTGMRTAYVNVPEEDSMAAMHRVGIIKKWVAK